MPTVKVSTSKVSKKGRYKTTLTAAAEEKQASQYARSLIEASLDPLVTISPDGKITDVNEATIKVTGVTREGIIGTDFSNRNSIKQERNLFKILIENINSGIALYSENKFLFANKALLHLLEYDMDEFMNLNAVDFFETIDDYIYNARFPIFSTVFANKFSSKFIYRTIKKNNKNTGPQNKVHYISIFRTALIYNNINTGLAIFSDVTEQVLKEQWIEAEKAAHKKLSGIDGLTRIYNPRLLKSRLKESLRKAEKHDRVLSLIMFSIDRFKDINEIYGSEIGNFVLAELSNLVKNNLTGTDFFARCKGEEFMIITYKAAFETAKELAEKLRFKIGGHDFNTGWQITCSFGVTAAVEGDTDISVINRVNKALLEAQNDGRNKVCIV